MKTNELIEKLSSAAMPIERLRTPSVRLLCWLTVSMISVAGWIWFFGVRPELNTSLHQSSFWLESLPVLFISILSAYVALALGVPGSTNPIQLKRLGLFSLLVWLLAFVAGIPYRSGDTHPLWSSGPGALCLESIIELSLVPAILMFLMIRKTMPTYPGWNGAAGLFAVSSLAAWGTQWICPFEFPLHFLVWHLIPAWLLGLAGYWLGSTLLKWRTE